MKVHAISHQDGSTSIVYVLPRASVDDLGPTIVYPDLSEELAKWSDDRKVTGVREISPSEIPTDRTFRDAWVDDGVIAVDMPRARNICRDRLRVARSSKLAALDVEMSRVYNDRVRQDEIEARRQVLPDVTDDPAIAAAQTPDELRAVLPAALRD